MCIRDSEIFEIYQGAKYVGTDSSELALGQLKAGPPVGHSTRAHWKPSVVPAGPVGLLLYSAHCHACAFDSSFVLHTLIETPISILSDPIQFIKPLVRNLINKSRGLHASATRTALATCPIVDFQILRTCISKVPDEDDSRIIRNHVAQAGWTLSLIHI